MNQTGIKQDAPVERRGGRRPGSGRKPKGFGLPPGVIREAELATPLMPSRYQLARLVEMLTARVEALEARLAARG